jgi:transposase
MSTTSSARFRCATNAGRSFGANGWTTWIGTPCGNERVSQWPKDITAVMEASFGWGWLSDLMVEAGIDVRLSNCYKVEQMRKARGWVKTNDKDASLLAQLPQEATNWWEVWRAPAEVRDRREWMRYRSDLVGIQTQTKNRIHAIFHRHGIFHEFSDLFGVKGRSFLRELWRDGGGCLSGGALTALRGQVMLLLHLRKRLADVALRLRKELERNPLTRRLTRIPGFGLILAHVLLAEIGRIERFRNHRALASYALLAPRSDDTGEPDPRRAPLGRHLGQRGNRMLKWTMIEAAHGAVRRGGKWRALFDRHTNGGKTNRNRGYIKVARELIQVVFVVWSKDVPYLKNPPSRPGSRRTSRKEISRSGTGQLQHPMVVAG